MRCFRHHASLTQRTSKVVIALGSNQGDRAELLRAAVRALPRAGVDVAAYSSLYETAPAYVTDQARAERRAAESRVRADASAPRRQPPFLNAAVKATTQLPPHELLRELKAIEAEMGRNFGGQVRPAPA